MKMERPLASSRLKVAMDLYDLLAGVNNTPAAKQGFEQGRSLGTPAKLEERRLGRRWGLP